MRWVLKRMVRKLRNRLRPPGVPAAAPPTQPTPEEIAQKAAKHERIRTILRDDIACQESGNLYDFLSDDLRRQFNIVETTNVSSNQYDPDALAIIEQYRGGLILDCGAGFRSREYEHVVNFEICDYPSTDVRGVGEQLPFRDRVFDAVFSFAVLEHVKDPFACAREIARVLKPGGILYCVVPFLQPLHGYPSHYFNMSHQGLRTLFEPNLTIEKQHVPLSGHPVWTLCWIISRWAQALPRGERFKFLNMRLGDLLEDTQLYLPQSFVTALSEEVRFELASTTALIARKP